MNGPGSGLGTPTAEEKNATINEYIRQTLGTDHYYKTLNPRIWFSDGVKLVAVTAGAYWLIDLIVSYQTDKRITGNDELKYMQFWKLRKTGEHSAVAECYADSGRPPTITQEIEHTDFPWPTGDEFEIWVEEAHTAEVQNGMLLMLPAER